MISSIIGPIAYKRAIKQVAGWAATLTRPSNPQSARACVLVYHRVTSAGFIDARVDDWNVEPGRFEQQIATLACSSELVSLSELTGRLANPYTSSRPLVCLTFDDGYANFYTEVLPILKRYHAPATAFVVTSVIGQTQPMPFDRWSHRNRHRVSPEAWRPMDWRELEACAASGLVTIGAHSHRHLRGRDCTRSELIEEAEQSRTILRTELGEDNARSYAYPYGSTRLGYVPPAYVAAVQASGYELAVTTDMGLVSSDSVWHLLPRVEAYGLDAPKTVLAKVCGCLGPLYLADRLRRRRRAV
jgi:peptidoglycan/xylan/chitin deacetylase (PgdA/CDA1 family)